MLKIAWHADYAHPLPSGHRFPMEKYELLPAQLLHEGTIGEDALFAPGHLGAEDITLAHSPAYWGKLVSLELTKAEIRRTGFPLSKALVDRETRIMQGTVDCAHFALEHGIAMNIAGGTHHAFPSYGEGFCLLNDLALAVKVLMQEQAIRKPLIVDLDVHQGNGTAAIFADQPEVFTFSMHGEKNFPLRKESSSLDIELPDGTTDAHYLKLLDHHLKQLIQEQEPDFIAYQCGVDVLSSDKLGRLGLSLEGCKQRDKLVLEQAHLHGIPVVAAMGGGYSEDIKQIIEAHANTFRLAQDIYF